MPTFTYRARTANGELVTGLVEAAEENTAAELLLEQKLTVVSLGEVRASLWQRVAAIRRHVRARDIVIFFRQLSVLISASAERWKLPARRMHYSRKTRFVFAAQKE